MNLALLSQISGGDKSPVAKLPFDYRGATNWGHVRAVPYGEHYRYGSHVGDRLCQHGQPPSCACDTCRYWRDKYGPRKD